MKHANKNIYYIKMHGGKSLEILHLIGVSQTIKTIETATDKGLIVSQMHIMRLPIEILPDDFIPDASDMITTDTEILTETMSDAELKHKHNALTIKAVTDNRDGLSPHFKLECV